MTTQEPTIRRGVRNARYSAIPNQVFEDMRLSMEARWLLCYLLSKPDHWIARIRDIRNVGNCGRDKATSMVNELIAAGYAEREQVRAGGKFGNTVLVVYDEPRIVETPENQAVDAGVASLPQPDLPAPVKPEPVLPGPVNPTHSKDLEIVITDSSNERESAREASEKDDDLGEAAMVSIMKKWPSGMDDSRSQALREWFKLTFAERTQAIKRIDDFIAAKAAISRTNWFAFSSYLSEKRWEMLPAKSAKPAAPTAERQLAKPFGKAWGAKHFAGLCRPVGQLPPFSALELRMIDADPDKEFLFETDKRLKYGWPDVVKMHDLATGYPPRGVMVEADIVAAGEDFIQVKVGDGLWNAWKALHAKRKQPMIPEPDVQEWVWFPPIDPDIADFNVAVERALDAFRRRIEGNVGAAA